MARITCSKSGVPFQCEYMPANLHSSTYTHPLFNLSKKKLLSLTREWAANHLPPTETYLLYLSLLNSTDLIEWRTSARYTERSASLIANNMESLIQIIGKIDLINHPAFTLPRFVITHDTGDLSTSFYWIQAWAHNYNEFMDGYKASQKREELKTKLDRRENSLEHLLKSPHIGETVRASNLAHWAAIAGNFPDWNISDPFTKQSIPIYDYWQRIIRACANEESIWRFPKADIEELIEHCEDPENIVHGSIYAHALMSMLRGGLRKHGDYLGFGDVDLAGAKTTFRLMDNDDSAESVNLTAAIQSAPDEEPKRHLYPTLGAYMRAKLNWDLKAKYKKDGE